MSLPAYDPQIANPQEQGFPFPEPPVDPLGLTPSGGAFTLPHFVTFSQLVNYVTRTYRYTTDEAIRHCIQNALAMRNEPVIMQAVRTRQMPVTQLSWHLEPDEPTNTSQKECAGFLTKIVNKTHRKQQAMRCLDEAIFYGKYGIQLAYRWDWKSGYKQMIAENWVPINGDKLVFKYDSRVGVLVHSTYNGNTERTDRGLAHFFTPAERQAVIVHEFEPEDADFFSGEQAGVVHGLGIRGRIYWLWWARNHVMAWMLDYLQRVGGGGFIILYYEHGNNASYNQVKQAFQSRLDKNVILMPRYRDNTTGGPGIQIVDPNVAGQQLMIELIGEYFDAVIRRYILGTTGSADQGPSGVGEGWADLHAGESSRIIKYDAIDLDETRTEQWIDVLNFYNCPGNPCPSWHSEIDVPNADEWVEGAKTLWEMGGQIDEEQARQVLGLSVPLPGHPVLSQIQPQAPVPVTPQGGDQVPEGTAFEGEPGPEQQQPVQKSRTLVGQANPFSRRVRGGKAWSFPTPKQVATLGGQARKALHRRRI
jgi:hypothetical protein